MTIEKAALQSGVAELAEPSHGQGRATRFLSLYVSWLRRRDIPFLVCSVGMICMLIWAGGYKLTRPGADGIVPLVTNSPLISWQFRILGTYHGADLIGLTEWTAALLLLTGYVRPRAGLIGSVIATVMFLTTSSMLLTTPGAIVVVHGVPYMSFMGLFLYKDILCLGVALLLSVRFGEGAMATCWAK